MEEQARSDEIVVKEQPQDGMFVSNLERRNSKIKSDRAKAIGEDAEIRFRRDVEDIKNAIRKKERAREDMLDLSGDNAFSTMPTASDFDDAEFSKAYRAVGIELRNLKIAFDLAKEDYSFLFGKEFA